MKIYFVFLLFTHITYIQNTEQCGPDGESYLPCTICECDDLQSYGIQWIEVYNGDYGVWKNQYTSVGSNQIACGVNYRYDGTGTKNYDSTGGNGLKLILCNLNNWNNQTTLTIENGDAGNWLASPVLCDQNQFMTGIKYTVEDVQGMNGLQIICNETNYKNVIATDIGSNPIWNTQNFSGDTFICGAQVKFDSYTKDNSDSDNETDDRGIDGIKLHKCYSQCQNTICTDCIDKYYLSNNLCLSCNNECATCVTQASHCLSCISDYFLSGNQCKTCQEWLGEHCLSCDNAQNCNQCQSYYYYLENGQCHQCGQNCLTCANSTSCQTCDGENRGVDQIPICSCNDGYFEDSQSLLCEQCQLKCLTCTDEFTCTTCADGEGRSGDSNSNCDCIDGYFDDGNNSKNCQKCQHQCETCQTSNDNCLQCISGDNRNPYPNCLCKDGYYENQTTFQCEKCPIKCQTCININQCDTCADGEGRNMDINTNCGCVDGYFEIDHNLLNCQKCQSQCKTCESTDNNCTNCVIGSNRYAEPDCTCKKGYYEDKNTLQCELCPLICETCQDENTCITCADGEGRSLDPNQNCNCQNGYYEVINSLDCLKCQRQCATCQTQDDNCISCINGDNRNSDPDCNCKNGYFDNLLDADCQKCSNQCAQCDNSSDQCTLCISGDNRNPEPDCSCLPGFYEDQNSLQCLKCPLKCATCRSYDYCDTCADGEGRNMNISTNCGCEDGYYDGEINTQDCQKCEKQCLKCENTGDNCSQCISGPNRYSQPSCECQQGYYENRDTLQCQKCPLKCETCEDQNTCLICADGEGRSLDPSQNCNCIEGYYDDGVSLNCQKCQQQCESCESNSDNCLSCIDTINRNSYPSCLCKDGYYEDENHQCIQCPLKCTTCRSYDQCETCADGEGRNMDITTNCGCLTGYFDNQQENSANCQPCSNQCQTCSIAKNNCQQCITGANRNIQPDCNCIQGYYEDQYNLNCYPCTYPCDTCEYSSDNCLKCINNVNRNQAPYCTCMQGYYEDSLTKECMKCAQQCSSCNSNDVNCLFCQSDDFRFPAPDCKCLDGYYENTSQLICSKCSEKCLTCSDQNTCLSCNQGYKRTLDLQNNCDCEVGYYDNQVNLDCKKCPSDCFSCIDQDSCIIKCNDNCNHLGCKEDGQCLECKENYHLKNGQCVQVLECHYSCYQCRGDKIQDCYSCNENSQLIILDEDNLTGYCIKDEYINYDQQTQYGQIKSFSITTVSVNFILYALNQKIVLFMRTMESLQFLNVLFYVNIQLENGMDQNLKSLNFVNFHRYIPNSIEKKIRNFKSLEQISDFKYSENILSYNKFVQNGIQTEEVLFNLIFVILFLSLTAILAIINFKLKNKYPQNKIFHSMSSIFNQSSVFFLLQYFTLDLHLYLFFNLININSLKQSNTYMSLVIAIGLVSFEFICIYKFLKRVRKNQIKGLQVDQIQQNYKIALYNINQDSKLAKFNYLINFSRKVLFAIIIVICYFTPLLATILLLIIQFAYTLFISLANPYNRKYLKLVSIIQEVMMCIIMLVFCIASAKFKDTNTNLSSESNMLASLWLTFMGLMIFFTLLIFILEYKYIRAQILNKVFKKYNLVQSQNPYQKKENMFVYSKINQNTKKIK